MIDPMLEAHIWSRMREKKRGQTIEQLQHYLKAPETRILAVLEMLRRERLVVKFESGVWTIVPEETLGNLVSRSHDNDTRLEVYFPDLTAPASSVSLAGQDCLPARCRTTWRRTFIREFECKRDREMDAEAQQAGGFHVLRSSVWPMLTRTTRTV